MKVSVAIANYNDGHLLVSALEALCTQSPGPNEVVVVDDCSTDNSMEVIASYQAKYPFVRVIRHATKSEKWWQEFFQVCLHELRGDYIQTQGADDLVYPGLYRALHEALATYPDAGIYYTDYHVMDLNGN